MDKEYNIDLEQIRTFAKLSKSYKNIQITFNRNKSPGNS